MNRPQSRTSALASVTVFTAAPSMALMSRPFAGARARRCRCASIARPQADLARISARRCPSADKSCVRSRASEAALQTSRRAPSASSAMNALVSAARRRITATQVSISGSSFLPNTRKNSPVQRRAFFARADRRDSMRAATFVMSFLRWPPPASRRGACRASLRASSMALNCSAQSSLDPNLPSTSFTKRSSGGVAKGGSSEWLR
mmetsp:Transcript_106073/g.316802  ORF Transcript_106073/g.316802 Transcript_106073/m.316802 type:complete len:205 (-) Transcript_106073:183-797(-)